MNICDLNKDSWQYLFEFLDPKDWYSLALLSKKFRRLMAPHIKRKYNNFLRVLSALYQDTKPDKLSIYCLRPLKKGYSFKTGCDGQVADGICSHHLMGDKMCVRCKLNHVDPRCYGKYCNSPSCRDYMWVLWNGEAVRKRKYQCSVSNCERKTDGRYCLVCSKKHKEAIIMRSLPPVTSRQCLATKADGKRCTKNTTLETRKCKIHTFNVNRYVTIFKKNK